METVASTRRQGQGTSSRTKAVITIDSSEDESKSSKTDDTKEDRDSDGSDAGQAQSDEVWFAIRSGAY